MTNLFENVTAEVSEGQRGIPGAALLKSAALGITAKVMAAVAGNDPEVIEQVKESQTSTAAMDELVKTYGGAELVNAEVAQFGEEEVQKLLKSNQSNRSRRKSMPMTQANYQEMLTAAAAEWIIRESLGITKNANPFGGGRAATELNEQTIAELADDQEALGRAIRNVQSKKSTYKAKNADRDYENDEEWIGLLDTEAALKAVRISTPGVGRKGVSMKKALQFILDGVDPTAVKKDEAVELLTTIIELSKGQYPESFLAAVETEVEDDAVMLD